MKKLCPGSHEPVVYRRANTRPHCSVCERDLSVGGRYLLDRGMVIVAGAHMREVCPNCLGTGERVLNPDWPSGTEPYSEKCPDCGGSGMPG